MIRHQRNALYALAAQLQNELRHRQAAINWLAAGHGNGVVIQNFVGDIDACCHGLANRQAAGVKIRAVAEVLKNVFILGKGRLPYPGHPFAAHLGKGDCGPRGHPGTHIMAANAAKGDAALGHLGRGIVRAARTVMRRAINNALLIGNRLLFLIVKIEALFDFFAFVKTTNSRGNGTRHHGWG